jgi:UDP-glucose 4-epimerase
MACEGLIGAYCHLYGLKAIIYRLANIVGPRCHGVIPELCQRLRKNPAVLEVLGDGTQLKSYCHVSDCVEALLLGLESGIYNVGSEDAISVKKVADIINEEMGIHPAYHFMDNKGGRGWPGDVKRSWLSIGQLKQRGWKPRHNSEEAVRRTIKELLGQGRRYNTKRSFGPKGALTF